MSDIEQISEVCKEIEDFYINKSAEISKLIINKVEAENLFESVEVFIIAKLNYVFGFQHKTNESNGLKQEDIYGLTKGLLSYTNAYKESVLFSYWSHRGYSFKENYTASIVGQKRGNIYYKGIRWKNQELRGYFYYFFDKIKNICGDYIPVDFFTNHGINDNNTNYLKVTTCKHNKDHKEIYDNNICLPLLIDYDFQSPKFKELIDLILDIKSKNLSEANFVTFNNTHNKTLKENFINFNTLFNEAISEAKTINEPIIIKYKDLLNKFFSENLTFESIFKLITSYQYYDIPYSMHFFLPARKTVDSNLTSCLAITLPENISIEEYKAVFSRLSEAISYITVLEKSIWIKASESLSLESAWQDIYEKYEERLERLSKIGENIANSFCKRAEQIQAHKEIDTLNKIKSGAEIKPHLVTARIKEFKSFYNKIINRANGKDTDFTSTKEYIFKIKNPNINNNSHEIISELKDLVGIRIICKYLDDIERITKYIDSKKVKKTDLMPIGQKKDFTIDFQELFQKSTKEILFYRSIHYCFELGSLRKTLIEYIDLVGFKFEIQIRTTLSQGWADASHDLYYKPNLSHLEKERFRNSIRQKLNSNAVHLEDIDRVFDELKFDYLIRSANKNKIKDDN